MERIASRSNKQIKLARSLANKKFRDQTGLMLVEGANLLKDLPVGVRLDMLFVTEERLDEAKDLVGRAEKSYIVSDDVMASLSDTVQPYGIAAVCPISRREFELPTSHALLLDGVSDPGNLGTIFRTAAACGFEQVYLYNTSDVFSPKVVRASLGAIFRLKLYEIGLEEAVRLVSNVDSAALDMGGEDIFCSDATPTLLIAGNEAHGVSKELIGAAKHTLGLPMSNGIESLNVAVATAVAMYQILRRGL